MDGGPLIRAGGVWNADGTKSKQTLAGLMQVDAECFSTTCDKKKKQAKAETEPEEAGKPAGS